MTLTDEERIAAIREVLRAAGDWHEATKLLSVRADLNWLLDRAARPVEVDPERLRAALAEWDAIEGSDLAAQFQAFLAAGKMADAIRAALSSPEPRKP